MRGQGNYGGRQLHLVYLLDHRVVVENPVLAWLEVDVDRGFAAASQSVLMLVNVKAHLALALPQAVVVEVGLPFSQVLHLSARFHLRHD